MQFASVPLRSATDLPAAPSDKTGEPRRSCSGGALARVVQLTDSTS